jgi:Fic family protein
MLGECQSKCEHIAGVPLRPDIARRLHEIYLAKGSLATTAIEGNTLSEEEVIKHIEGKLWLPPSMEYLAQEVDNIIRACNAMLADIQAGHPPDLSPARVRELNRAVLDKLAVAEGVVPGEIRKHEVGVARYRGAPAEDCEHLLGKLCDWLRSETFAPPRSMSVLHAILKAVLAHLHLVWIHPFGDGNGRTARLVEFQILITSGVPAPAAHLLSNHYSQTRAEYYRQLDASTRAGADVMLFLQYAVQGFVDGLRSQLATIRDFQWDVAWRNYVHEAFRDKTGEADVRRRHLVLDLSASSEPVPLAALRELTPRLAAAYAGKTPRTLSRDVNTLVEMGLVERTNGGVRARREVILAFLPLTAVLSQSSGSCATP